MPNACDVIGINRMFAPIETAVAVRAGRAQAAEDAFDLAFDLREDGFNETRHVHIVCDVDNRGPVEICRDVRRR